MEGHTNTHTEASRSKVKIVVMQMKTISDTPQTRLSRGRELTFCLQGNCARMTLVRPLHL